MVGLKRNSVTLKPGFRFVAEPAAPSGLLLWAGEGAALSDPWDPLRSHGVTTLLTTSTPSIASNASSKPHDLHDLDAAHSIHTTRTWLRALWTEWSVEVRVLSGALEKPRVAGLFSYPRARSFSRAKSSKPTTATKGGLVNQLTDGLIAGTVVRGSAASRSGPSSPPAEPTRVHRDRASVLGAGFAQLVFDSSSPSWRAGPPVR
jgi:hypothetical protein